MERLTQWYDDGKIRGVLVKDGYEENALQTIVTKIDECYAAVALLKEYEDTGLTPEQIRELKERDTAKAPIKDTDLGVRYTDDYICPNCRKHFTGTGIATFCYHCGQRIRWEDE